MSCLKEWIEKICGTEKGDEILKCIQTLATKENHDLSKTIIDSYTKIKLKELEIELEKSKSTKNLWSQIVKYSVILVVVLFLFYDNSSNTIKIIQALKNTSIASKDFNRPIDSNCTTINISNPIIYCDNKPSYNAKKRDTNNNVQSQVDCNQTSNK